MGLLIPAADMRASDPFLTTLKEHHSTLDRSRTEILQINVGKLCNITCVHCHVNAGPARKEIITRQTIDQILPWLKRMDHIHTVDLTGGTPEMIPDFRYLINELKKIPHIRTIMDRLNATILVEPGFEWASNFLADHKITLIASMPCYSPQNVNKQRGQRVFERSIKAFQMLNELGYGKNNELILNFVYNPNGAFLPPDQKKLEADYKREMKKHFDIDFNHLYTITNMPIARFASYLKRNGAYESYMNTLKEAFNPSSVDGLMCKNTLSIGWQGEVYDCDFNQQLAMRWKNGNPKKNLFLWDIKPEDISDRPILTGTHCFGCTAGAGSSCGGALT
ncbi:MAG: arsenosugar biosynthesis radical SAM (seleno)protein ArsS [Verrucomicrobiota bacterium]